MKILNSAPTFNDSFFRERALQRTREIEIMTKRSFFPKGLFVEVGAGTAVYTKPILAEFPKHDYFALDMSFYALKIRRKLLRKPNSLFILSSVDNLPLKEKSIACMFLIGILLHSEQKENSLLQLMKYIRSEGVIYLDEVLKRPSFLKHKNLIKGVDVSLHEEWILHDRMMRILKKKGEILYHVIFNTPFYRAALKYAKKFVIMNRYSYKIVCGVDFVLRKSPGIVMPSFQAGEVSLIWRSMANQDEKSGERLL